MRVVNSIVLLTAASSFPCIFIFPADSLSLTISVIFIFVCLGSLLIFKRGFHSIARHTFLFGAALYLLAAASFTGRSAGFQFLYLPIIFASVLLFDTSAIKGLVLPASLTLACWMILEVTDYSFFSNSHSATLTQVFYYYNFLLAFTLTIVTASHYINIFVIQRKTQDLREGHDLEKIEKVTIDETPVEPVTPQPEEEKIQELDKIRSGFVNRISHEFKTSLTLIVGPLDELIKTTTDPSALKQLKQIHENGLKLLKLINDLPELSKLNEQTVTHEKNSHDIHSVDEDTSIERSASTPVDMDVQPRKPLVLIVEDSKPLRTFLTRILSSEFDLVEAEDGEAGLKAALFHVPDLIASDIMMPEMDGLELCRRIKAAEVTSHIPVILLTALSELDNRLEGLETGADYYLAKPFEPRELLTAAHNLIEQRHKLRKHFSKKLLLKTGEAEGATADERFLQKLVTVIENNLSNPDLTIEDLQKDLGISRMQLHRKLKALTDKSATEFVRTIRLKRAAEMLERGQDNVSQIAYTVGFNSLSYFTKCFKEQFGVLPSAYAEKRSSPTQ